MEKGVKLHYHWVSKPILKKGETILWWGLFFGICFCIPVARGADSTLIQAIYLKGHSIFTTRAILEDMQSRPGGVFSGEVLRGDLLNLLEKYRERAYYFTRIDSVMKIFPDESPNLTLSIFIDQGLPLKVDGISLQGMTALSAQGLKGMLETRVGGVLDEENLAGDIEFLLRQYENNGYPFCRVSLERVTLAPGDEARVQLLLKIEEGDRVTIGQIRVRGNHTTRSRVIIRETGLKNGDPYRHKRVARARRRLERLGFFEEVKEPRIFYDQAGSTGILFEVVEKNTNRVDGVLGYSPSRSTGEKGYFTGLLDFSFRNLLGTGRRAQAHWERIDRFSQELTFSYLEPWVLGYPFHVGIDFSQLVQDTTYIKRAWGGSFSLPAGDFFILHSRVGQEEILPDSSAVGLYYSRNIIGEFGVELDTRDDRINPRRGMKGSFTLGLGDKRIFEDRIRRYRQQRYRADLEGVLPTLSHQVLAVALHLRWLESDESPIPISEHFRFGGAKSLRGYREDQFRGSRVGWSNLEYRFLIARQSRLFAFVDIGYYYRGEMVSGGMVEVEGVKVGYGVGLRLETRLGIMGVDYGLGEGDSPFAGKVHLGLTSEF